MSNQLNLEEVRRRTMEILGTENPDDVSYITQELLDLEYVEQTEFGEVSDESTNELLTGFYGHNMSYCTKNGRAAYCYQRGSDSTGSSIADACGHTSWFVYWDYWTHQATSSNCNESGSADHKRIIRFYRR